MLKKIGCRYKHIENISTCLKSFTRNTSRNEASRSHVHLKSLANSSTIVEGLDHRSCHPNPTLHRLFSTCTTRWSQDITKFNSTGEYPEISNYAESTISSDNVDIEPNECVPVDYFETDAPTKPNVLQPVSDNFYLNDYAPPSRASFNIAPFADKSDVIQKFISLGVEVAVWEKDPDFCEHILKLDFDTDIKPYIFFLHHNGVPADSLGRWLTINPYIFKESLENLEIRVNYMLSKKFSKENIGFIINRVPKWLSANTFDIDAQLGRFQKKFDLTGSEVRHVATRDPKLILYSNIRKFHLERTCIAIQDEFGFEFEEMRKMLLDSPRIFRTHGESLIRRLDTIHNKVGFSHETIAEFPKILLVREQKILNRSKFLKEVGRDQYDPTKPNYICIQDFIVGSDEKFCTEIAKLDFKFFDDFLKTL